MGEHRPWCRALSDWQVEQAHADWRGGAGVPMSNLAEEYGVASKTLKTAFERLEAWESAQAEPERRPEPGPIAAGPAPTCASSLTVDRAADGSVRVHVEAQGDPRAVAALLDAARGLVA